MKNIYTASVLIIAFFYSKNSFSAPPEFRLADTDNDGVLSSKEARQALPGIIVDLNNNGFVDKSEAKYAIPTLELPAQSGCQDNRIREQDYQIMVQELKAQWDKLKQGLTNKIYLDIQ